MVKEGKKSRKEPPDVSIGSEREKRFESGVSFLYSPYSAGYHSDLFFGIFQSGRL